MKDRSLGFSLVEVTIALGIISFCVVSVFALLPIGMNTIKQGRDARNAVELINKVTGELTRRRTSTSDTNFLATAFTNVSWAVGKPPIISTNLVSADGRQVTASNGDNMQAWLELVPPANKWSVGSARVSVAWPSSARRVTDGWTNAQGSVDAVVFFNP